MQVLLGAATLDAGRISRAIAGLAEGPIDASALRRVVDAGLLRLTRGARPWPGLDWLTGLLDEAVTRAGARFGADLMLFRKAQHMAGGVVADVAAQPTPDAALAASFLAQLSREAGRRPFAPPLSRAFASHISNADLAQVFLTAPLAALRYGSRLWSAWPRDRLAVAVP